MRRKPQNLCSLLIQRETENGKRRQSLHYAGKLHSLNQIPYHLKERELCGLSYFDKIFAAQWYGYDKIIAGTKDNKLIEWDLMTTTTYRTIDLPRGRTPELLQHSGIHSIAISPSQNVLATGAYNPAEIAIFQLPQYYPLMVLTGHTDWTFCMDFLSEDRLVSGSRDTTVGIWSVDNSNYLDWIRDPIQLKKEHVGKVRSLVKGQSSDSFFTLGVEGTIKSWASSYLSVVSTIDLPEKRELSCMAIDKDKGTIAIGSQSHVSLLCTRSGRIISTIPSHDDDWGVRSLNFHCYSLTIGGGAGHLAFFDMRKNEFMKTDENEMETEFYLETGPGWLDKDEDFHNNNFDSLSIPNAIYTHSFDPTGTRLFVGGGPLMIGLKGCYAGIW